MHALADPRCHLSTNSCHAMLNLCRIYHMLEPFPLSLSPQVWPMGLPLAHGAATVNKSLLNLVITEAKAGKNRFISRWSDSARESVMMCSRQHCSPEGN